MATESEITAFVADIDCAIERAIELRLPTVTYLLEMTAIELRMIACGADLHGASGVRALRQKGR